MNNQNTLFNPETKIAMECEYFQTKNDIFDLEFKVKTTKRYKENGNFIKGKMVVEYRELDSYETLIYIYLCRCANNKDNAFPSYNTIAKKVKCSRRKAIDSIAILNENGFIYKKHQFNSTGDNISNIYYINTELLDLKNKLDNICSNKKNEVVSTEISIDSASDTLGSASDALGGSASDAPGSASDAPKKEQYKNNNIKKEQYNNNNKKKDVVVKEEERTEELIKEKLDVQLTKKEIKAIVKTIKEKYSTFNEDVLLRALHAVVYYANPIKNIGGFINKAIREDYAIKSYNHKCNVVVSDMHKKKDLKFKNFDERQYDYDSLEKQLLGWED